MAHCADHHEQTRAKHLRSPADTLYEVLGVSESATTKEIKAAYRKRAVKLHPDVNKAPDAKERFMECKTAYETLMDEQQRRAYDRSRKGFGGGFPGGGLGGDFGKDWDEFGRYARCAHAPVPATFLACRKRIPGVFFFSQGGPQVGLLTLSVCQ